MKSYAAYLVFLWATIGQEPLVQKGSCTKDEMKSFKTKIKTFYTFLDATKQTFVSARKGAKPLPPVPDFPAPPSVSVENLKYKNVKEVLSALEDDARQMQGDVLVASIEEDARKAMSNGIKNTYSLTSDFVTSLGAVKKVSRKPSLRKRSGKEVLKP